MIFNPTYTETNEINPTHIVGSEFEEKYVKKVYSSIAEDFSRTRYSYWKVVHDFILKIEPNSKLLDMGCGNGKYLSVRNDLTTVAIDSCEEFIEIVKKKYPTTLSFVSSVEDVKLPDNSFDYIISIAVIHHLSTETQRIKMIREILRLLKVGGKCLLTAWATEQSCTNTLGKSKKISDSNDYLIPWTNNKNKTVSYRFYHLFVKNEFAKLVEEFDNVKIIMDEYKEDNWILEIQ